MTPSEYTTLRQSLGSQRKVAPRLGIHWRTIQGLEAGDYGDPVPIKYALAIKGLISEQGER